MTTPRTRGRTVTSSQCGSGVAVLHVFAETSPEERLDVFFNPSQEDQAA
jgi:hypothetical protein